MLNKGTLYNGPVNKAAISRMLIHFPFPHKQIQIHISVLTRKWHKESGMEASIGHADSSYA